jgi:hypothetical protein
MDNRILTLVILATLTACSGGGGGSGSNNKSNIPETDVYLGGAWNLKIEETGYQCDKSGSGIINVITDGQTVKSALFDGIIKDRYPEDLGPSGGDPCNTKTFIGEAFEQWVGFDKELTKTEFLSGLLLYYLIDLDIVDILINEFNDNNISVTLIRTGSVRETYIYTKESEPLTRVYLAGTWQIYATKNNIKCNGDEFGELQVLTDTITIEDSVFNPTYASFSSYGDGDINDCRIFYGEFNRPLQDANFDWLLNSKANLSRQEFLANIVAYYMNDTAIKDIRITQYTDSYIEQVVSYGSGFEYKISYRR